MKKATLTEIKRKRDGGGGAILPLPHIVLNSDAFLSLKGRAVKLLIDIAMQYNTYNNGALLASWNYMSKKRGWTSADQLAKAKAELIEKGFLVQTVQGMMPNKASWYGITWWALDQIKGLEIVAKDWPRGAYSRWYGDSRKKPVVRVTDLKTNI
ncbi:hypothetical protein [Methylotenera sp. N17]|uniref:hypothetical protein n=1 Tax=Methylotenera sp. N17 TaxID=1502761 RepID=UPI000647322D|nr:hypothetical protein [Methylotenera sp. N17]